MIRNFALTFFSVLATACLFSQVAYEWHFGQGDVNDDNARSIAIDDSSNVYVCGVFSGTIDFDPGAGSYMLTSNGGNDAFIQKLDSNGVFIWAQQIGGAGDDGAMNLVLDDSADVHIVGNFNGTVDFDNGSGTAELINGSQFSDGFMLTLDRNGGFEDVFHLRGNGPMSADAIAIDTSENVYVTGNFSSFINFDDAVGTTTIVAFSDGARDPFAIKVDAQGDGVWGKVFEGPGFDIGTSIAVNDDQDVFVGGFFVDSVDFDPSVSQQNILSNGNEDAFVLCLDSLGELEWVNTFGSTSSDRVDAMDWNNGRLSATGSFRETVDFDPGATISNHTSSGGADVFALTLNGDGDYLWSRAFGAGSADEGFGVEIDDASNVYLTGYFNSTVDFDPSAEVFTLTAQECDVFIQKLDQNGDFQWVRKCGSPGHDVGRSVAVSPSASVYNSGFFVQTCDFNPGPGVANATAVGGYDGYVLKLSDCSLETGFTQNGDTLIANATNVSYQWYRCEPTFGPIAGATSQSYTILSAGTYALQITEGECVDYSDCMEVGALSTNDLEAESFIVYPNPTINGKLTVEGKNAFWDDIVVRDASGRIIDVVDARGLFSVQLELPTTKGSYFLTTSSSEGRWVEHVIVL